MAVNNGGGLTKAEVRTEAEAIAAGPWEGIVNNAPGLEYEDYGGPGFLNIRLINGGTSAQMRGRFKTGAGKPILATELVFELKLVHTPPHPFFGQIFLSTGNPRNIELGATGKIKVLSAEGIAENVVFSAANLIWPVK